MRVTNRIMLKTYYLGLLIVAALVVLPACVESDDNRVEVKRLDLLLRKGNMEALGDMRDAADKLFKISGYGELTDSALAVYSKAPSITLSTSVMDSVWGVEGQETVAFIDMERAFGSMVANFRERLPAVALPSIYAVVSPFNQSVFTVDSVMFLGLNHYLGVDYEPYGYFPDYIRRRKVADRILPDVAEALVRRDFPYSPAGDYPTVLSRLLYEGAVTEAVMQLTGLDECQALGYDESEWEWLEKNERELWYALAGRKLLFSTDDLTANMLVGLSPVTTVLHHESPGYAGRFIGHRIVASYLKYNKVALSEILSPVFYDDKQALSKARY